MFSFLTCLFFVEALRSLPSARRPPTTPARRCCRPPARRCENIGPVAQSPRVGDGWCKTIGKPWENQQNPICWLMLIVIFMCCWYCLIFGLHDFPWLSMTFHDFPWALRRWWWIEPMNLFRNWQMQCCSQIGLVLVYLSTIIFTVYIRTITKEEQNHTKIVNMY